MAGSKGREQAIKNHELDRRATEGVRRAIRHGKFEIPAGMDLNDYVKVLDSEDSLHYESTDSHDKIGRVKRSLLGFLIGRGKPEPTASVATPDALEGPSMPSTALHFFESLYAVSEEHPGIIPVSGIKFLSHHILPSVPNESSMVAFRRLMNTRAAFDQLVAVSQGKKRLYPLVHSYNDHPEHGIDLGDVRKFQRDIART